MDTKESEEGGLQRGDIIADKYRVEQEIGRGGMGVVVAATHLDLDQRVAIKVLQKSAAYNQDAMARFLREARAAAKIRSEHVARVMDVGKLSDGLTYIVMEFLDGSDLADVLVKDGPMRITTAADYILQACEGIAAAHAAGIIHRDIKPANLFLARQPGRTNVIKILDFGVSKFSKNAIAAADGSATQTGQVFGSPIYMSPEQLDSTIPIDGRTDIWALGIVLYELLAGKPPFNGKSSANIMTSIMRDPAPKLRAVRADVPEALEEVVMRCLEKEREQRFSTVIDLAEAIAPFCGRGADDTVNRIYQILAESANAPGETTLDDSLGKPDASPSKSSSSGKQSDRRGSGPRRDSSEPSPSIGGSSHTHGGLNPQSKRRIAAVGFVGIAALGVAGVMLSARTSPSVPAPAAQQPPEESQAKAVVPPVVSEAPTPTVVPSAKTTSNEVTITFTGAPKETKVFRGEAELGTTEKPLLLPRSSDKIVLRFVADTFATTEMELIPNVDQTLAISLKPAKPSATTPNKRKVPKELEPF
jgi:eukaryotic-like serine/threonine-protein kinase